MTRDNEERRAVVSTKITAARKKAFRIRAAQENLTIGGKLYRLIEDYLDGDSEIGVRHHFPFRAARIDRHGHPAEMPDAFGTVHAWLERRHVMMAGHPIVLFPDAPFPEETGPIAYSCLFPIAEDIDGEGTVRIETIAAGDFLSIVHRGPRETLPRAYAKMRRYAEENAFVLQAPGRQILLTAPYRATREDALTEIQVPFARG